MTIQNVSYGHDSAANVISRTDSDTSVNTTESFAYDEMNKLKKWTFSAGSNTWTTDYAPGTNGVIKQASGVIQQTKTGTGAQSLAYDYYGNSTSQLPHAARNVNAKSLGYDIRGRQVTTFGDLAISYSLFDLPKTINSSTGTVLATYKYDANNNRVHKTYSGQTTASLGGLYERRVSSSGVVSHVMYIRGPGNRVVAQETWTESGTSVNQSPVLYHHDDIIGSTVVTNTAATSASATRLRYDPFGLRIAQSNPTQAPVTIPTRIGFTGHEMDDEFNLINMRGRIYDPKIARFMSPDPLVSAPNSGNGYDRYGYALNNPMKYTDPSGLMIPFSDQILAGLGYDASFMLFMRGFNEKVEQKIRVEYDDRKEAQRLGISYDAFKVYQTYVAAQEQKALQAQSKLASSAPQATAGDDMRLHSRGVLGSNSTVPILAGQVVQWTITNMGPLPTQFVLDPTFWGKSQSAIIGPFGCTVVFEWAVGGPEPMPWTFNATMSNAISAQNIPRSAPGFSVAYTIRSTWVPSDDKK